MTYDIERAIKPKSSIFASLKWLEKTALKLNVLLESLGLVFRLPLNPCVTESEKLMPQEILDKAMLNNCSDIPKPVHFINIKGYVKSLCFTWVLQISMYVYRGIKFINRLLNQAYCINRPITIH